MGVFGVGFEGHNRAVPGLFRAKKSTAIREKEGWFSTWGAMRGAFLQ